MKSKLPFPLRLFIALVIGAGCAAYAPYGPLTLTIGSAVKFVLWGGAGFLCTFGLTAKLHKRLLRYALPLSFLLALSFTLGAGLQVTEALRFGLPDLLTLTGLWALCFLLVCHLFVNVPGWLRARQPRAPLRSPALARTVFLCFFVLACGWLLAFYPIMTNYDIHAHLSQIATGVYETHHSLLYTLLMQGFLWVASALNLGNAWAFLALGLLQAAVMGLAVAYGLVTMNKAGADRRAVMVTAVYFCVFPLFGYFAFSTTKDTLFACFVLLAATELYRLSRDPADTRCMARMALYLLLACLMRYNGILTLLLFTAGAAGYALLRALRRKRVMAVSRRLLALVLLALVLCVGASALLNFVTGAVTPDTVSRDTLSLPLQQMARVLQTAADPADIARIEGLFGVPDIKDWYRPDIADPVKAAFLFPGENVASALRAWLKMGVKYPKAYLEGFLELTRGAWFLDDLSHTKIDYWLANTGYLETMQRYTEEAIPIAYQTPVPALRTFLESAFMGNRYLDVPLLRYFFALAVQTWIAVLALFYAAYHRRPHATRLLLFTLCVLLPIFLLPCMISRYFLPLFLLNPLCLLSLTVTPRKENAA